MRQKTKEYSLGYSTEALATCLSSQTDGPSRWRFQRPPQLVVFLFSVALFLGLLHITTFIWGEQAWQFERAFYLGRENNVPTWFSSILLFLGGLLAVKSARNVVKTDRFILCLFGGALFLLSCDEVASLHESVGSVLIHRIVLPEVFLEKFPVTSWPIFLAPPVLVAGFLTLKRLRLVFQNCPGAFWFLVFGCGTLIFGAFVLELFENALIADPVALWRPWNTFFEELLEMIGSIFIIWGFCVARENLMVSKVRK